MAELKRLDGGKLIGIKISTYSIFNKDKYDPNHIPQVWSQFFSQYLNAGLPESKTFYSAALPIMSMDSPMGYYAGAIFSDTTEVPSGFDSIMIEPGDYFCVTHNGPIAEIGGTVNRAYIVELPESGKKMRHAPHLEIYNSDKEPMDPDYSLVLAIPVE